MKKISINLNEVIRTVLNFLFSFLRTDFARTKKHKTSQKSTKKYKKTQKGSEKHQKHKKAQRRNQAKAQNANKRTKIKNALKKYLNGKKSNLFAYLRFCVFCVRKEKKK